MHHRKDQSRSPRPIALGDVVVARWDYGFDEPGLQNGFDGLRSQRDDCLSNAFWQEHVYRGTGCCEADRPVTLAGRARYWLFTEGGIVVVLVVGLLAVAIVGGLLSGR